MICTDHCLLHGDKLNGVEYFFTATEMSSPHHFPGSTSIGVDDGEEELFSTLSLLSHRFQGNTLNCLMISIRDLHKDKCALSRSRLYVSILLKRFTSILR